MHKVAMYAWSQTVGKSFLHSLKDSAWGSWSGKGQRRCQRDCRLLSSNETADYGGRAHSRALLKANIPGTGLITIKEAHDIEARLNEVEKLLKTIINMPWKYSRSEVVLTFFERSPLDQVLKNDNVHKIQPSFQSPVKISEIMRSNGFCLANTETIVIDHSIPNGKEKHLDVDSAEHLFESVSDFTSELEDSDDPTAYVTNLTYYHLVPFETDILD
ncbi:PX domain-containing protein 1 isoform X2 [Grus americana]|uniref:PX domain-containing protein 1 isoform X2 n=1 Tax=Grus americana TaxID=9117 RepID=UPI0024088228|nr:PX domain-containing protein 1 isoform X2 [Grus americana]